MLSKVAIQTLLFTLTFQRAICFLPYPIQSIPCMHQIQSPLIKRNNSFLSTAGSWSFRQRKQRSLPDQNHDVTATLSGISYTSLFGSSPTANTSTINTSLIRQQVFNQALIGYTIWTGGQGAQVLSLNANFFYSTSVLLGIVGFLPLFLLSQAIETSESQLVANLNLSTNMTVLRMFGAVKQPIVALVISALLSGLTGLVEETIFRGEILPYLSQWATAGNLPFVAAVGGSNLLLGTILSTVVFAALHVNPLGFFAGKDAAIDALVLFALQMCTGATFAILYLLTGNLAVPIIAHAIYDFYTFYATHLQITSQMEYAQVESLMPVGRDRKIERNWIDQRGEDFVREAKETFYLMDSNRDGVVSRRELRVALYSYGIRLSEGESEVVLENADADGSGAVDFDEFLQFIGPEGDTSEAVKQSLLGVG